MRRESVAKGKQWHFPNNKPMVRTMYMNSINCICHLHSTISPNVVCSSAMMGSCASAALSVCLSSREGRGLHPCA